MKLSPLQVARRKDPGGLWRERKAFVGAIQTRLDKLGKAVAAWAERAAANPTLVANALPSDPAKAKEFQTWLEGQLKDGLLEVVDGPTGVGEVPWTDQYVRPVYRKSLIDTYAAAKGPLPEGLDGQAWLQQAFNGPVAVRSLGHIYNRQYAGLKDITTSMEATLQRTLVNAMAQGKDVKTTARELQQAVGFSKARATTFATTELQHAYAEGQLDAMDALGVSTVNLAVEWLTAGDEKVCPKCQAQAGKTYSTKDARGIIPFHPNCRCAWISGVGDMVAGALADGQKFIQEYNAEVAHKNALAEAAKLAIKVVPPPVANTGNDVTKFAPAQVQDAKAKLAAIAEAEDGYRHFDSFDNVPKGTSQIRNKDLGYEGIGSVFGSDPDVPWTMAEIPPEKIKYTQSSVIRDAVGKKLDGDFTNVGDDIGETPTLIYDSRDGFYHLQGGHHRAAAQILATGKVKGLVQHAEVKAVKPSKRTGYASIKVKYEKLKPEQAKEVGYHGPDIESVTVNVKNKIIAPRIYPAPKETPDVVPGVKPPVEIKPPPVKGIIGNPYDAAKVDAYVAANIDKKGYVRAFPKREFSKEELSLAKKGAKTAGEEVIDIAGLQTNNGGVYNTGIPAYAKKLADDPSTLETPIVVELPDGTRTLLEGDLRVTIALAQGDTQIKVKLVKLGAGAADDLAKAKAAQLATKTSAAEVARDELAKKLGLQGNAALPLNDKGLFDPGTVTLAFEHMTGLEYSFKQNMAPIIYERLRQAKSKQTLEGQIKELEALAKQVAKMPRRSVYKIGTPRGNPLPGTKAPGADLKPLREVMQMEKKFKHISTGKSLVEHDGDLVRAENLIFGEMEKRARAMEKQHDKITKGPKTPPPVKPVATKEAIKHSWSDTLVETDQGYLDKHGEINKAYEFLNRVGDRNVLAEAMPEVAIVKGRAYANRSGYMALDPFEDASTVIHEYTHHLEYKLSDDGYAELMAFYNKRKSTEAASQIYTREDLKDEVGFKDNFLDAITAVHGSDARATTAHYAGKIYPEYQGRRPTEILTIGAELLYKDPVAFAKADPEWFDLVEGVLSGRIR